MKRFSKVAILGNGAFGTALAHVASFNPYNKVMIYARDPEVAQHINEKKRNPKFFSDIELNGNISASSSFKDVVQDAAFILSCIPTQQTMVVLRENKEHVNLETPFVSCSKGMLVESEKFISEAVNELFEGKLKYCVLSGPSFAKEILMNMPTLVVVASKDIKNAQIVQENLSHGSFKVYTNDDVIGVEIAGALKNLFAIGAGFIEGSDFGINTTTAFIVRGTAEIQKFAKTYGARDETFFGLAGIGDLMLTSFGSLSRNRTCGYRLGKGESLEDIVKSSAGVVEGIPTLDVVYRYAKKNNLDMPITFAIYDLLHGQISLQSAVKRLMSVNLGTEFPLNNVVKQQWKQQF
ncbi:hypothetical protein ABPG72_004325 [Tetrahymena utriculariae]